MNIVGESESPWKTLLNVNGSDCHPGPMTEPEMLEYSLCMYVLMLSGN